MEKKIEQLLSQMTLEEKVSMAAGADLWHSNGVERLAIPSFKMTDGPNGARGEAKSGLTSACFPVGTALACSWNVDLINRVGQALGEEALSKGAQILLGPTVNIHRSPLAGRNFECYSEDPYLSARMAVAFINGVQSKGVGTSVKHFVCNDSEFERQSISSEVDERTLREIYLVPFEFAVKEANTWSVMSSYNKINGVWASQNHDLLTKVLKEEWDFQGVVISDWGGSNDAVACANGGLDLEMPGPARTMGDNLLQAVQQGKVDEAVVEDKCRRLMRILHWSGKFEHPDSLEEKSEDGAEQRQLARQAAVESFVLLKNEGVLPLQIKNLKRIAVIGPNATVAQIQGGGSSGVNPHYAVTPLDGIQARCGDEVDVRYAMGCTNHKMLPRLDTKTLQPDGGDLGQGFKVEFYNNLDLQGEAVETSNSRRSDYIWFGDFSDHVDSSNFSARLTADFIPTDNGSHQLSLVSSGLSRLYLNNDLLIDNWEKQDRGEAYFGTGSTEVIAAVELHADKVYRLKVEYSRQDAGFAALRIGCMQIDTDNAIEKAAKIAADSDIALLFVGLNGDWDTEGADRKNMQLPGDQVDLIKSVASANSNTVVVLNNGSSLVMSDWLAEVPAVLECWYPGQECGNAIADVLFGDQDPGGRLTQTFPQRLEDNPAFINYPGDQGRVRYGEGIFVGYRYYDKKQIEPLFPFGHGLSYSRFEYSDLSLDEDHYSSADDVEIKIEVKNTGERRGSEVVQLYIRELQPRLIRPEQELKDFAKVTLDAGQSEVVSFRLSARSLAFYDPEKKEWLVEPGTYELRVGSSSRNIRSSRKFELLV